MTLALLMLSALCGCKPRELTRCTPQMDVDERYWVRVLLLEDCTQCSLNVDLPFTVVGDAGQNAITQSRFEGPVAAVQVQVSAGRITIAGRSLAGREVTVRPDKPHIFNLNGSDYRGRLELIVSSDGASFDAINLVPVEPYLAAVVGAEMPSYWEPAALRAQAIAARTYCLYIKERFGGNRNWDVKQTAASQVYPGVRAESGRVWDAVNATKGQVLFCERPDGGEGIFPTYYSSACGGHTENSKNVFGEAFAPLVGVECPYCRDVAKPASFYWPTAQFDKKEVAARLFRRYPGLKRLGELNDMVVAEKSDYGNFSRVTGVRLAGSAGKSKVFRAESLRLAIDPTGREIRSTIFQFTRSGDKWEFRSGRGWGHGVGMCQCGVEGMARKGKTTKQILWHYYPGSRIKRLY